SRRWSAWRMGRPEARSGDWAALFGYIFGHKKILKYRKPGIAHLMLFWGFLAPIVLVILAQFDFVIPRVPALILSLLTDIIGTALLAGTIFFLLRRLRSTDQGAPKKVVLPLFMLLIILITGFLAEGARLSIVHPKLAWKSPLGWLLSTGLPPSPMFMHLMIRIHFYAVLFFIAAMPFTFMRHLAAAPLNVFYKRTRPPGALKRLSLDHGPVGVNTVEDFSWKQLLDAEACVSCGRCEENCPASISQKPLSPRKVIQDIQEQMASVARNSVKKIHAPTPLLGSRITEDEIWSCTTCMACIEHCPVFIEPMEKIIEMRRGRVMGKGLLPNEARTMMRNLEIYADVHGKGAAHRADWAFNFDPVSIQTAGLNPEILLWVGCSGAFHPRYQEVSRAMVSILHAAGIRFGILGKEESCCGDPARRLGEEDLFLALARKNIHHLKRYHIKKIVTLCPHCFNTLKNEYPRIAEEERSGPRASFEVEHATEYVNNLIKTRRISPKYPINKSVAFHDPCYLGRANHVYDPPREVINAVPGIQLKELKRHHEGGFCCGGGGGSMWLHEHLGRRMNTMRAEEVIETGVDLLGTACPYCLTMLEDGMKSLDVQKPPKVLDILEMVASSLR
ncbi:MAG: heterodisulfide reductase-related iron-sulfur binding cluster, partial [Desulfobacterales bacterium]|nr:heterodisulfide reductase-related iron-sulfur binding cluster [Desulfobacterales bacterium]